MDVMKLKPCPFCGGKPSVEFCEEIGKHWICCKNEKCRIQPSTDAHKYIGVVVREWNRRHNNGC